LKSLDITWEAIESLMEVIAEHFPAATFKQPQLSYHKTRLQKMVEDAFHGLRPLIMKEKEAESLGESNLTIGGSHFTRDTSICCVLERFQQCPNMRLKEILIEIVKSSHKLMRECEITVEELNTLINFLTRAGEQCYDKHRQEMVMIFDLIGLTALAQEMQTLRGTLAPTSTDKAITVQGERIDEKPTAHHHLHCTPGALLGPYHLPS
jgi:hypothetical protein